MTMPKSPSDRRRYQRAYLPIAASVFTERAKLGDYLVRNLSAGGALLSHGPPIPANEPLRVILIGRGVEGLSIRCTTRRSERAPDGTSSVAVQFLAVLPEVEDMLHEIVLRALDRVTDAAVLVVHPKPLVLASLAGDLVDLGRRVLLATTPLQTVRWLCDLDTTVETVLADQSHDPAFGRAILKLVQDDFPAVRRIALREGTPMEELPEAGPASAPTDVLDLPWTPSGLALTLERYGDGAGQRTSSPDAI